MHILNNMFDKHYRIKLFRYSLVTYRMIRWPMFLLLSVILVGGLFIYYCTDMASSFSESVYDVLTLSVFHPQKHYPTNSPIAILYFVLPLLGITGGLGLIREVIASSVSLKKRNVEWETGLSHICKKHIIVCGLGKIGTRVVQTLAEQGYRWNIVAINDDADNNSVLEVRKLGIPVIIGDMRKQKTLEQANVHKASTIIFATDNDETHFNTLLILNEIYKGQGDISIIFNVFDSRISQLMVSSVNSSNPKFRLYPVDLSNEIALKIHSIIKNNTSCKDARYALVGLGRIGFSVINTLYNEGVKHENITVIDKIPATNPFLEKFPLTKIPEKNIIKMDIVDFCLTVKNDAFDAIIVTTGDDLSNILFAYNNKFKNLTIIRSRSKNTKTTVNIENGISQDNLIWINTAYEATNKLIEVFKSIHSDN
jgi:hypothetical protein